jgi:hypothetical protein
LTILEASFMILTINIIVQYRVGITKYHKVLILLNVFVGCSKVLSDTVGIIKYHEGSKKHLDDLVPNGHFRDFTILASDHQYQVSNWIV